MTAADRRILIEGVAENNLRGFDLALPAGRFVAVTGVSGSGKSSLVGGTLAREGSRRALETFSAFARQFLERSGRARALRVSGLPPCLSVDQGRLAAAPRSTAGTFTGIDDLLRLLYSRVGRRFCHACGEGLTPVAEAELARRVASRFADVPCLALAPLAEDRKGACRRALARFLESGLAELRVDGEFYGRDGLPKMAANARHRVEALVARLGAEASAGERERAVLRALDLSGGRVRIVALGAEAHFSAGCACPGCGADAPPMGPRLFSFSAPRGACPECRGLAVVDRVDPALLVADPDKTLRGGALVPTTPNGYIVYSQVTPEALDAVCRAHGFSVDTPWRELTAEQREVIWRGSDRVTVPFGKHPLENRLKWKGITARPQETGYYKGIVTAIEATLARDRNPNALRFVRSVPCPACGGSRIRPEARVVRVEGLDIAQARDLEFGELSDWLRGLSPVGARDRAALEPLRRELLERLDTFATLGLGYLPSSRATDSLSGGEYARLRMAGLLTLGLSGMLYALDEPSAGLHPADRARLAGVIARLRDGGNSVVTVEHDLASALRADWLVEIGPGAGDAGGRLLYSGPPEGLSDGPTRAALLAPPPAPRETPRAGANREFVLSGGTLRNLAGASVAFLTGGLNVVTGPSGAGKSTLVMELLDGALRGDPSFRDRGTVEGIPVPARVARVDAQPIGRNARSNPATYTGLADLLRDRFAALPEARARGYRKGRFSFNTPGGRCEACEGSGVRETGLHFLERVSEPCESCGGDRFDRETLGVRLRGRTIAELFASTVEEARELFRDDPPVEAILRTLSALGLGYLRLGQPSPTLSGGEARRVKLAAELSKTGKQPAVFLLDEPSAGLHPADTARFLAHLEELVGRGHTVVAVEHNLDLIARADRVADLGPGGGRLGGRVLFQGTPAALSKAGTATGTALAEYVHNKIYDMETNPGAPPPAGRGGGTPACTIEINGATLHNVRDLSLSIPRGGVTVLTGVSGSGKSTLAEGVVARTARRRYLRAVPAFARRILSEGESVEEEPARFAGLPMAVSLTGETFPGGGFSTVGTLSGTWDECRLLWSRFGDFPDPALERRMALFSFRRPPGACPDCGGRGKILRCDPDLLVTDPERTVEAGALSGTRIGRFFADPADRHVATLRAAAAALGFDLSLPWRELDPEARRLALSGAGERTFDVVWNFRRGKSVGEHRMTCPWPGFLALVEEEHALFRDGRRGAVAREAMRPRACPGCDGTRLSPAARAVRFRGLSLPEFAALEPPAARAFLARAEAGLAGDSPLASSGLLRGIAGRLARLETLGLAHLPLSRGADTLSGGEMQRVKIAGQFAADLSGVLYVLDEPAGALHGRDAARLMAVVRELSGRGNGALVVEHHPEAIRAADHVIEMGPGAGEAGGRIVYQGDLAGFLACEDSPTARALRQAALPPSAPSPLLPSAARLRIRGACARTLADLDLDLPAGALTAICGVSGSGKSTLLREVLAASLARGHAVGCRSFVPPEGGAMPMLLSPDPRPPHPDETLAGRLGLLEPLRTLVAAGEEAREAGFPAAHFDFAKGEGRCPACDGSGLSRVDLDWLGEAVSPCPECGGTRLTAEASACRALGRTLPGLLDLPLAAFAGLPGAPRAPRVPPALELDLGHLALSRRLATLSRGEAGRLRLAPLLAEANAPGWILLDEPAAGLHPRDQARLIGKLRALAARGHGVVFVEHRPALLLCADHLVELGPAAGPGGGRSIYQGPPEGILAAADSPTGAWLRGLRAG